MTEYIGKHSIFQFKKPMAGDYYHANSGYRCPWCNTAFKAYDVIAERGFRKIKADQTYGYFQHDCGKVVACEWMRNIKN